MKRVLLGLVVVGVCLGGGIAGCAVNMTSGEEITPTKLATIAKGKTTRSEVDSTFGQPSSTTMLPDGAVRAVYMYSEHKTAMDPSTYIPIANMFYSGSTTKMYMQGLTVTYSSAGIVQDYVYTEHGQGSHHEQGMGLGGARVTPVSPR
jgi:hypothetical protein